MPNCHGEFTFSTFSSQSLGLRWGASPKSSDNLSAILSLKDVLHPCRGGGGEPGAAGTAVAAERRRDLNAQQNL